MLPSRPVSDAQPSTCGLVERRLSIQTFIQLVWQKRAAARWLSQRRAHPGLAVRCSLRAAQTGLWCATAGCSATALLCYVIGPLASPLEADCGPVEQRYCWRARCASSRLLRTLDSRGASTHPPHRIMHRSLGALSTSLRPTHRRVGTLPMSRAAQHGACAFRLFVIYLPAQIQPLHHCRRNWSGRKSIQTL